MSNNELKKSIPIKTYNQTKKTLKGIISRKEADLYEANNRINDLLDIVKQKDKIIDLMANEILEQDMLNNADEYRKLNPKNGWGSYDGLLATLQEMRNCCENNSDGTINVN